MMKKLFAILAVALVSFQAFAQTTQEYKTRYEKLVAKLGPAGVGVETLLDKWAQVDSCDVDLLLARFQMYLEKSRSTQVVQKPTKRYLGSAPIITLKDSLNNDVYYYNVYVYDDGIFGNGMRNLDKAIILYPSNLNLRIYKATALMAYEQDSPDMTTEFLMSMINDWTTKNYKWTCEGYDKVDQELFSTVMQEYCATLYTIGSDKSRESFKNVATKMLTIDKKNTDFLCDLGSYYMVKEDYKKAMKYYDQALKIQPDCYPAIKNCCSLAISKKDAKLQKKYLPMLVKYGSETESASAQVRLESLN